MLITSERHTCDDLEIWNELVECDRMLHRKNIDESASLFLSEFCKNKLGYIGVSWGKDSVVVAHLASIAQIDWPVVWIKSPAHNPDCLRVRDAFLSEHKINYHEICVTQEENDSGHGFDRAVDNFGECYVSGVRADESGIRKLSMRYHGKATDKTCRPIGWWKTQDVFSYLEVHELPVHPTYAMLGGGRWERNRLRVSSVGGNGGTEFGRREWEREYYPDILNRLQK